MELILTLTSPQPQSVSPLELHFEVENTPIGKKWVKALRYLLKKRYFLEKHYNFLGFPESQRKPEDIAKDLFKTVEKINNFGWQGNYHIDFDVKEVLTQEDLNNIHHHFEVLIGQTWNQSKWFLEAPQDVQVQILLMNHFIHEYEFKTWALKTKEKEGRDKAPSVISCAFSMAPHQTLDVSDKKFFHLKRTFGDVFLHYSQLGKTFEEAFNDDDKEIEDLNINGLRYYTGEFDIHLGQTMCDDYLKIYESKLKTWIENKGLTYDPQALGIGEIKVASLKRTNEQKDWSLGDYQDAISIRENIQQIKVLGSFRTYQQDFPYQRHEVPHLMQNFFKTKKW